MKDFLKNYPKLLVLIQFLESRSALLTPLSQRGPKQKSAVVSEKMSFEQEQFAKQRAARTIQRMWRKFKVKQTLIKNPYTGYLSLIDKNDEQRLLSLVMFGWHQAEIKPLSRYSIPNPNHQGAFLYHRSDFLSGAILNDLINEFNLSPKLAHTNNFIAVTYLKTVDIGLIIQKFCPQARYTLVHSNRHNISLLYIPKYPEQELPSIIRACGLIASPWEIAQNIHDTEEVSTQDAIALDKNLPSNYQILSRSTLFIKLRRIANNPRYPTHKLAQCLIRLITNELSLQEDSYRRIALMLDMAITFYPYNYARFAFCVYATVHELSLALILANDFNQIEREYKAFLSESLEATLNMFGLDNTCLNAAEFIACTANSGAHAYWIALNLATKMVGTSQAAPIVKTYAANYFEYEKITQESDAAEPDIYIFSSGPIVDSNGLNPGIDINQFLKHVIDSNRKTPVVFVVDATTALYKNLKLSAEAKALVKSGMLSIIIHESHQKFGLIHSDQAQHGRLLAICSKRSFTSKTRDELKHNAQIDFEHHIDMRIGAYISTHCQAILEDIKQQHFNYGAMLRNIFTLTTLIEEKIVTPTELMLSNLDELYFVNIETTSTSLPMVEKRDSFGHFHSTTTNVLGRFTRVSPNASDTIDSLIHTVQIYLDKIYIDRKKILHQFAQESDSMSIQEEIIVIALISVLSDYDLISSAPHDYCLINNLIKRCDHLKERPIYEKALDVLHKLRKELIKMYKPLDPKAFFKLNEYGAPPFSYQENYLLAAIKNDKPLAAFLKRHQKDLNEKERVATFILAKQCDNPAPFYPQILNQQFSQNVINVYQSIVKLLTHSDLSPSLYKLIEIHSPAYMSHCYNALNNYYTKQHPSNIDREILLRSLELSKSQFIQNTWEQDKSLWLKVSLLFFSPSPVSSKDSIQILHELHKNLSHGFGESPGPSPILN